MNPEPTDEHREAAKKIMIFLDRGANPDLDWVAFFLAHRDAEKDRVITELRKESNGNLMEYSAAKGAAISYRLRAEKAEALVEKIRADRNLQVEALGETIAELRAELQDTLEHKGKNAKRYQAALAERTKERDNLRDDYHRLSSRVVEENNRAVKAEAELSKLREPVGDERVKQAVNRAWNCGCGGHDGHLEDDVKDFAWQAAEDRCVLTVSLRAKTAALKEAEDELSVSRGWCFRAQEAEARNKANMALADNWKHFYEEALKGECEQRVLRGKSEARLKLCDDGTPDARGKFRVIEAEAKLAALEKKEIDRHHTLALAWDALMEKK